jgi:hypothetical protein
MGFMNTSEHSFCFTLIRVLSAEKDGLNIVQQDCALPKFEQRAEAVLRELCQVRVNFNGRVLFYEAIRSTSGASPLEVRMGEAAKDL